MRKYFVWDFRSSAMLRSVHWLLFGDVSGQSIGPIFRGQAVWFGLFEGGTDRLSRNVGT